MAGRILQVAEDLSCLGLRGRRHIHPLHVALHPQVHRQPVLGGVDPRVGQRVAAAAHHGELRTAAARGQACPAHLERIGDEVGEHCRPAALVGNLDVETFRQPFHAEPHPAHHARPVRATVHGGRRQVVALRAIGGHHVGARRAGIGQIGGADTRRGQADLGRGENELVTRIGGNRHPGRGTLQRVCAIRVTDNRFRFQPER